VVITALYTLVGWRSTSLAAEYLRFKVESQTRKKRTLLSSLRLTYCTLCYLPSKPCFRFVFRHVHQPLHRVPVPTICQYHYWVVSSPYARSRCRPNWASLNIQRYVLQISASRCLPLVTRTASAYQYSRSVTPRLMRLHTEEGQKNGMTMGISKLGCGAGPCRKKNAR
jgi:hypothetical protein